MTCPCNMSYNHHEEVNMGNLRSQSSPHVLNEHINTRCWPGVASVVCSESAVCGQDWLQAPGLFSSPDGGKEREWSCGKFCECAECKYRQWSPLSPSLSLSLIWLGGCYPLPSSHAATLLLWLASLNTRLEMQTFLSSTARQPLLQWYCITNKCS